MAITEFVAITRKNGKYIGAEAAAKVLGATDAANKEFSSRPLTSDDVVEWKRRLAEVGLKANRNLQTKKVEISLV